MSLATLVLPPELIRTAPDQERFDLVRTHLLGEADAPAAPGQAPEEKKPKAPGLGQRVKQAAAGAAKAAAPVAGAVGRGLAGAALTASPLGAAAGAALTPKVRQKLAGAAKTGASVAGGAIRGLVGAPPKKAAGQEDPEAEKKPEEAEKKPEGGEAKPESGAEAKQKKDKQPAQANRNDPSTHHQVDGPGGQKLTIVHGTRPGGGLQAHPQHQGVFVDPTTGKHYAPAGHPIHQFGPFGMGQMGGGGHPFFPGGGGGAGLPAWMHPAGQGGPQPPQGGPGGGGAQEAPAAAGDPWWKRMGQGAFAALDAMNAAPQKKTPASQPAAAPAPAAQVAPAQAPAPATEPAPPAQAPASAAQPQAPLPTPTPAPKPTRAAAEPAAPATAAAPEPVKTKPAPKETRVAEPGEPEAAVAKARTTKAAASGKLPAMTLPRSTKEIGQPELSGKTVQLGKLSPSKPKTQQRPAAEKAPKKPPAEKPMPSTGHDLFSRLGFPGDKEKKKKEPESQPEVKPSERLLPAEGPKAKTSELLQKAGDPASSRTERAQALQQIKSRHGEDSQEYRDAVASWGVKSPKATKAPEPAEGPQAGEQPKRRRGEHAEIFSKLQQSHPEVHQAYSSLAGKHRDDLRNANRAGEKAVESARAQRPDLSPEDADKVHRDAYANFIQKRVEARSSKEKEPEAHSKEPETPTASKTIAAAAQQTAKKTRKKAKQPAAEQPPEVQTASYNPPLASMIQEWIQ